MGKIINSVIKALVVYVAQVGALWGILEAYTYFQGNALEDFLGPYWILIYIVPWFTTAYVLFRDSKNVVDDPRPQIKEQANKENIATEGHYSPGKVGGHYTVQQPKESIDQATVSDNEGETTQPKKPTEKSGKNIHTKGNFSPGEVGGDYKIEH